MTGQEILRAFEGIGAVVRLTPGGNVEVDSPNVPAFADLCAEVKAHRAAVVEELKRRTVPTLPGREAARPCLRCGRECEEEELFDTETCFSTWRAERAARREKRGAAMPATARTAATSRALPFCGGTSATTDPAGFRGTPSPRGAA